MALSTANRRKPPRALHLLWAAGMLAILSHCHQNQPPAPNPARTNAAISRTHVRTSNMTPIRYPAPDTRLVVNQDRQRFHIGPGEITGLVHVQPLVDLPRNCSPESGLVQLTFRFAAADKAVWTHGTVLWTMKLWPTATTIVRQSVRPFRPDAMIKFVGDTRESPTLRFDDGSTHNSNHKYNDLTFLLRCDERALAVRMIYYAGEVFSAPDAFQSVDYELDYAGLLWRPAPKIWDDDISPEDESHVEISRTDITGDDAAQRNLRPSPIRVSEPDPADRDGAPGDWANEQLGALAPLNPQPPKPGPRKR